MSSICFGSFCYHSTNIIYTSKIFGNGAILPILLLPILVVHFPGYPVFSWMLLPCCILIALLFCSHIDVYVWSTSFWLCPSVGLLFVLSTTGNCSLAIFDFSQSGLSDGSKLTYFFLEKSMITERCNLPSPSMKYTLGSISIPYSGFQVDFGLRIWILSNWSVSYVNYVLRTVLLSFLVLYRLYLTNDWLTDWQVIDYIWLIYQVTCLARYSFLYLVLLIDFYAGNTCYL